MSARDMRLQPAVEGHGVDREVLPTCTGHSEPKRQKIAAELGDAAVDVAREDAAETVVEVAIGERKRYDRRGSVRMSP